MKTADERIEELIARAGSPVMIVKGDGQYSASARMEHIDKQARMMAHQQNSPKYECTISIMSDEIIAQDAKIRDMANTIDRLEAALHNVINERDQLKKDLNDFIKQSGFYGHCAYCAWIDKEYFDEPCKTCLENSNKPNFEWRGVTEVENDGSKN